MKRQKLAISVCLTLAISAASFAAGEEPHGVIDLFNGENLDGWYVYVAGAGRVEEQDFFSVENGAIRTYGDQEEGSDQPSACLITREHYGDYRLKLEYKWGDKKFRSHRGRVRDAGVMFHLHGPDRVWPDGVQYQIQEGDTGDIWALGTKVSSMVHKVDRSYSPGGQWVTRGHQEYARFHRICWRERPGWNNVEVDVEGNRAVFRLNGHVVNEAINIMRWDETAGVYLPLDRGKILLQAEGSEIYYRNITLEPVEPRKRPAA